MVEHINKTDTLNEGRVKLNAAISDSNVAKDKATQADVKSTQALAKSDSTQTQLDTIVIEGDSSVEAAQARVDEKGEGHATLKARIDDGFERTSSQLAQIVLDVKDFGAIGDGVADDTQSINDAIIYAHNNGLRNVKIPNGSYLIDAEKEDGNFTQIEVPSGIIMKDNINLLLDSETILKAKPTNSGHYAIISVNDCENVTITGGTLKGERNEHLGTSGEWGFGIQIIASNNVEITGVHVKDCWGDGFYLRKQPSYITLENCKAENNRRQGMSITSGKNLSFNRCVFKDTNGIAPQAGVDIEPNTVEDEIENIRFQECEFLGNAGRGLVFDIRFGIICKNVRIVDCSSIGNLASDSVVFGAIGTGKIDGLEILSLKVDGRIGIGLPSSIEPIAEIKNITIDGQNKCKTLNLLNVKKGDITGVIVDEGFINFDNCEDITISNSKVSNSPSNGVMLSAGLSRNIKFINVTSIDNVNAGFLTFSSTSEKITVLGANSNNNGANGFDISASYDWTITDSIARDNGNRGLSTGRNLTTDGGIEGLIFTHNRLIGNTENIYTPYLNESLNLIKDNLTDDVMV